MNNNVLSLASCAFVLVCLCVSVVSYAEVYKCKNPDGTITYSERACSGSSVKQVVPWREDDTSITPKEAERKDKAMQKFLKEFDAAFNEIHGRCRNGDMTACKETACAVAMLPEGSMEDLVLCAKSKNLPYGRDWAIVSGDPSSSRDIGSLKESVRKLPEGGYVERLTMVCWRKNRPPSESGYYPQPIVETMVITKGRETPTFTFAEYSNTLDRKPPEHRSLQELANQSCRWS